MTLVLLLGRFPLPTTVPKVLGCVIADYSSQRNVERTMNSANPPDFLSTQVNGVFHDHAASAIQVGMNRWARRADEHWRRSRCPLPPFFILRSKQLTSYNWQTYW